MSNQKCKLGFLPGVRDIEGPIIKRVGYPKLNQRSPDTYLKAMKRLGFRESILYFQGGGVKFKMVVDETDYLDQLGTVLNILGFNTWLTLGVVSYSTIHQIELNCGPIKEMSCVEILRYSRDNKLFDSGNRELILSYIDMLENKVFFPSPPKWLA